MCWRLVAHNMAPSIEAVDEMMLVDILDANEYIDVSEDAENIATAAHAEARKDPDNASKFGGGGSAPIEAPTDPELAAEAQAEVDRMKALLTGSLDMKEFGEEDKDLANLLLNPPGDSLR